MPHWSFDPDFQKHIVAAFLEKDLGEGIDCLKEEFFEDEIVGDLAGLVREFFLKHEEAPGKEAMLQEVKEHGAKPGRKLHEYYEAVEEVYGFIGQNGEYYRKKASAFADSKKLAHTLKESYRLLEEGGYEEALALVQKKAQSNSSLAGRVFSFLDGIEERAKNYFDSKRGENLEGRVSTGFPLLDERLQGGLGAGETGIILAPAKNGKTTALVSFAANALFRQKKVLYVTLELSQKVISARFDCNIFGQTLEVIKSKPKTFMESMQRIREEIVGGNLHIAEFPTKSLTVHRLGELIEKQKPEIVFIDYASLLRPSRSKDERRFELSDIHESLRGVAGKEHVPIWTAHQANRPAFRAKEVGMEHTSEDIQVAGIADVIISLNQMDEEKRSGILRLHIAGNRLGASGDTIACKVNWALSRVTPEFGEIRG